MYTEFILLFSGLALLAVISFGVITYLEKKRNDTI